jgi:anti-sigma-K factor RskA
VPGDHITQEEADEFALGVVDPVRAREIALHVAACDECQARLDAAEDLTARLALSLPVERPSDRVRTRVFQETGIARPGFVHRLLRVSGAFATAAALGIAGLAIYGVFTFRGDVNDLRDQNADLQRQVDEALSQRVELAVISQQLESTNERVDDLLARAQADRDLQLALLSPKSRQALVVNLEQGESGPIGRFVWDPEQGKFWFVAEGLAPQPTGKTYELFAGDDGTYVSLGTFNSEADGFVLYKADVPAGLSDYDTAAVTIEDTASNRQRSGPAVFVLNLDEQGFRQ